MTLPITKKVLMERGLEPSTIERMLKDGRLRARKYGRTLVIDPKSVEEVFNFGEAQASTGGGE